MDPTTAQQLAAAFKQQIDQANIDPADVISEIKKSYIPEISREIAEIEDRRKFLLARRTRLEQ